MGLLIHMAKTRSRSPATDPLSFHFPISLSLRLQCSTAKNIPTHSQPAPAGCELLQLQKSRANLSSKPNRPDHQTEPIARPLFHKVHTILQASTTATAHSDRRPRNRRPDIITIASPTNRADEHGKHLSPGPRKHIFRNAGFCQPRLLLLVRA